VSSNTVSSELVDNYFRVKDVTVSNGTTRPKRTPSPGVSAACRRGRWGSRAVGLPRCDRLGVGTDRRPRIAPRTTARVERRPPDRRRRNPPAPGAPRPARAPARNGPGRRRARAGRGRVRVTGTELRAIAGGASVHGGLLGLVLRRRSADPRAGAAHVHGIARFRRLRRRRPSGERQPRGRRRGRGSAPRRGRHPERRRNGSRCFRYTRQGFPETDRLRRRGTPQPAYRPRRRSGLDPRRGPVLHGVSLGLRREPGPRRPDHRRGWPLRRRDHDARLVARPAAGDVVRTGQPLPARGEELQPGTRRARRRRDRRGAGCVDGRRRRDRLPNGGRRETRARRARPEGRPRPRRRRNAAAAPAGLQHRRRGPSRSFISSPISGRSGISSASARR